MLYSGASYPSNQRPASRIQATARRLRLLACVVLGIELAFVMGILSCNPQGCSSGQPNPTGYSCGSTSGGGAPCWAMVSFCCGSPPSGGFFSPSRLGYHTSIYINQATAAGDGSIGHTLALLASNSSFSIMVGYENLASAAILQGCSNVGRGISSSRTTPLDLLISAWSQFQPPILGSTLTCRLSRTDRRRPLLHLPTVLRLRLPTRRVR